MTTAEIARVLELHGKWWRDEEGGKQADLRGADLGGANLGGADLTWADLRRADLRRADLRRADLREADLTRADLRGADLTRADFDYSCWPLWCGSFGVKCDDHLAFQLACHLTRLDYSACSDDVKAMMAALKPWANRFCKFRENVKEI